MSAVDELAPTPTLAGAVVSEDWQVQIQGRWCPLREPWIERVLAGTLPVRVRAVAVGPWQDGRARS